MPIVKEIKRATLDEAPHLCLDRPWRGRRLSRMKSTLPALLAICLCLPLMGDEAAKK